MNRMVDGDGRLCACSPAKLLRRPEVSSRAAPATGGRWRISGQIPPRADAETFSWRTLGAAGKALPGVNKTEGDGDAALTARPPSWQRMGIRMHGDTRRSMSKIKGETPNDDEVWTDRGELRDPTDRSDQPGQLAPDRDEAGVEAGDEPDVEAERGDDATPHAGMGRP
jgi:hypothetical protein